MIPEEAASAASGEGWAEALLAVTLLAVDGHGLGGIVLKGPASEARDRWLAVLRGLLAPGAAMLRMPVGIGDDRLLGGLDLAASLAAGRRVAQRGLAAEAHGGLLVAAGAERLGPDLAARLAAILDRGEVAVFRDGIDETYPAAFGVVAFDEGIEGDERPPSALLDRLALGIDASRLRAPEGGVPEGLRETVVAARTLLPRVAIPERLAEGFCAAAAALGITSVRVPLLALRTARAAAALGGRTTIADSDAETAARLVLAWRATALPQSAEPDSADAEPPDTEPPGTDVAPPPEGAETEAPMAEPAELPADIKDLVLAAAQAAIPPGLLAALAGPQPDGGRGKTGGGRAGALKRSQRRGRPAGARAGDPRRGARLDLLATLAAAAPWQVLRRREANPAFAAAAPLIRVRRGDLRITRFKQRAESTTIFGVDASGSSALHRLAEAKGAVELLLADCYARRDRVALLAFRDRRAELLLPPTRALARARRSLAGLPGGGATPLAAALDLAAEIADEQIRAGRSALFVLLTDGRANIARDGAAGRPRAEADALESARALRARALRSILIDTSPRPQPGAARLAAEMGARYVPLPNADAAALSAAIRENRAAPRRSARVGERRGDPAFATGRQTVRREPAGMGRA